MQTNYTTTIQEEKGIFKDFFLNKNAILIVVIVLGAVFGVAMTISGCFAGNKEKISVFSYAMVLLLGSLVCLVWTIRSYKKASANYMQRILGDAVDSCISRTLTLESNRYTIVNHSTGNTVTFSEEEVAKYDEYKRTIAIRLVSNAYILLPNIENVKEIVSELSD